MVARLTKNDDGSGWWRVSYGEINGLSREELVARQPMKFEAMLPGHPKPSEYSLAAISPYKIHQRIVDKMRVGRFMLAADAAHRKCILSTDITSANRKRTVNNPFGGLGLTGGLTDVGGLYDCLIGVYEGKADESILDKYSEMRRQRFKIVTDPISTENIKRLYDQDPDKALENDDFLKLLKSMENDREKQVDFMKGPMALWYDFTQHYKTSEGKTTGSKNNIVSNVEQIPAVGVDG